VEEFETEDREELRKALRKYSLNDLNEVDIRPAMSELEFQAVLGSSPGVARGGGWFMPGSSTRKPEIVLNPILPAGSTLDHEMGHMLYYKKEPEHGFTLEMDELYEDKDYRDKVADMIGDPYCKKNVHEFCAEGFEMMMDRPNYTAEMIESTSGAKTYFTQIMKDIGYKVKREKGK